MIKRHGRTSSRPSTPIHCAGEVCRSELELKDLAFCIGSHDLGIAGRMPGQSRFIPGASSFETERKKWVWCKRTPRGSTNSPIGCLVCGEVQQPVSLEGEKSCRRQADRVPRSQLPVHAGMSAWRACRLWHGCVS